MEDNLKAFEDHIKLMYNIRNVFDTASPEELNDMFPVNSFPEVEKMVAPIWKRYYEAKASNNLENEKDDINAAFRATEYFLQFRLLCIKLVDLMEIRAAQFHQDKPKALQCTADHCAFAIIISMLATKMDEKDIPLKGHNNLLNEGNLDVVEELSLIFPDFKPDTSSFTTRDGKYYFTFASIEKLIQQFTDYILERWKRHFSIMKKQIESNIKNKIEPELGVELTSEEKEALVKNGMMAVEDDQESVSMEIALKAIMRSGKTDI